MPYAVKCIPYEPFRGTLKKCLDNKFKDSFKQSSLIDLVWFTINLLASCIIGPKTYKPFIGVLKTFWQMHEKRLLKILIFSEILNTLLYVKGHVTSSKLWSPIASISFMTKTKLACITSHKTSEPFHKAIKTNLHNSSEILLLKYKKFYWRGMNPSKLWSANAPVWY